MEVYPDQWQAIFDAIDDFLFVLDFEGRILAVNLAVEKRLGYTREELVGESILLLHPPEQHHEAVTILADIGAGKRNDCPLPLWSRDCRRIPVDARFSTTNWGAQEALVGVYRDVADRRQVEQEFLRELNAMTRLQRIGALSVQENSLEMVLTEIVGAAIAISGADFGNIQMVHPTSGDLKIVAQHGFPSWWIEFWNAAAKGSGVCGTALELGERVIVEDVEQSPIFLGTPAREMQRRANVRAMQSTPLVSRSGKRVGVFSTHYRQPGTPDLRALRLLDLLARQAADIIEHAQTEAALRESQEQQAFLLRLSDMVRPVTDPVKIEGLITRTAMEFFGADRCYYCELVDDCAIIRRDACRSDLPSVVGRYPMSELPIFQAVVDAGHSFVVRDVYTTDLLDESLRQLCIQLQIISFMDVPVIIHGQPIGILCTTQVTQREWTDSEVNLAQELAERTWTAVERGRAETALQQLNGELEQRVAERTAELRVSNDILTAEICGHQQTEHALQSSNRQLQETLKNLKNTQEQLIHQERLAGVGQLAAGIAHDFNNILTGVLGFTELLQLSPDTPEAMQARLQKIHASGQRAAQLVRQLLDYSRKTIRHPKQLELDVLLREHITFLQRAIPENIRIVPDLAPGDYQIEGDVTQLQQVITNLTINAKDAMPAGGRLEMHLLRLALSAPQKCAICNQPISGDWVCLTVADNGSGIAAEVAPHIFEPFFTTKEVGKGTGLGLAQVGGIVEQHNGHITVQSQPDCGATFTLYFPPTSQQNEHKGVEIVPSIVQGRSQTILLVEDEPAALEAITWLLEHLHYQVITAANGREALAAYWQHPDQISMVLSDMVMPDMDGAALFHALKTEAPDLRMVVMSGYPLGEEGAALLAQGVVAWLEKPITFAQLSQAVDKASAHAVR